MQDFFSPKSIAVVGASKNPTKLGSLILHNLIRGDFEGKIYPVNKNSGEISGLKAYKKVSEIPGSLDIVCLVIPAQHVLETIRDSIKKSIKGLVIITAGFGETGEEGKELENKIKALAKKHNIRILGPNCLGFINNTNKTNLSFAANKPLKGDIAFLSQSGAFCTAMLDMSIPKNLGFSHFVSVGNKADINELELFNFFLNNTDVKVISAYLEDIVDGSLLIQNYEQSKNKKPVIILKAGQTKESQKAIESHTGAIAGSIEMFKTGVQQAGIIEAHNTRDLFNYMMMFSWSKPIMGKKIAIITNAGGPGIIATDSIVKNGLEMAEISIEDQKKLKETLPPEASVNNPIDIVGDATAERYKHSIDVLANSPDVDAIIILLTPQLVTQIEETTKLILHSIQMYEKPIIPIFIGKKYILSGLQRFYDNHIPTFTEIDDAILSIKAVNKYYDRKGKLSTRKTNTKWEKICTEKTGLYHEELNKLASQEAKIIPDKLAEKIALEVGLTLPKQIITKKLSEILDFSEGKYPVVLKAANEVMAHKTDFKGIYLNITDPNELLDCYERIKRDVFQLLKLTKFNMVVQEQLKPRTEFFIGVNRDGNSEVYKPDIPGFGHLIVFGQGGIYAEIHNDFGYVLVPASKEDIEKNLMKTKIYKILEGARGQEPMNIKKVIEQIYKVQQLTLLYPEIVSLDINPLIITQNNTVSVDIKLFIKK